MYMKLRKLGNRQISSNHRRHYWYFKIGEIDYKYVVCLAKLAIGMTDYAREAELEKSNFLQPH